MEKLKEVVYRSILLFVCIEFFMDFIGRLGMRSKIGWGFNGRVRICIYFVSIRKILIVFKE